MTAYYFAARYSRNPELREYRDQIVSAVPGSAVTSRWIDLHPDIVGGLEQSFTPEAMGADPAGCWEFGQHDLEDLSKADAIVSFTGNGGGGKGGRHIEHGIAIAYVDNHMWLSLGGPDRPEFRLIVVGAAREHLPLPPSDRGLRDVGRVPRPRVARCLPSATAGVIPQKGERA